MKAGVKLDLEEIIIGIDRHVTPSVPRVEPLNIGSSDLYINYHRRHYNEKQIQSVNCLEPEFYLLENLTILAGGEQDDEHLKISDSLPIFFAHCNNNYLHFLFENIGRILFLNEKGVKFKSIIGVPMSSKSGQNYLDVYKFLNNPLKKIGLNPEDVFIPYFSYRTITFPKIITTTLNHQLHMESYSITTKLLRKHLRENGEALHNIYISRRYADKNPRFIQDEEKIEKYYANLGYKIIYNESLTFEEQINLYKNAKHLVGISGTGLVNILFAPDDCKLTELRTSDYRDDDVFKYLCKYLGNEYELITSYDSHGSADIVLDSIKSHL